MNRYFKIILSFLFIVLLQSCATTSKKPQSVHGDKPLIDTAKIIVEGRKDMDKKVREGPKPYDSEIVIRGEKRKTTRKGKGGTTTTRFGKGEEGG